MENKKLVNILLKDMGELEELIAEIKSNRHFDELEMEFLQTRAKGVSQLLQLLVSREETASLEIEVEQEVVEKLKKSISDQDYPIQTGEPENHSETESVNEQELPEPELEEIIEKEPVDTNDKEFGAEKSEIENEDDEMLEDEVEKSAANSRLGDSFLKGKSVNDIITDQNKLEFKLSNRPVTSIQSAIGINDRFQYIRELFDGDNQKYLEAVKTLDTMNNIKAAVDYLRQNYKWKKNETSLKFVNLVKRRFLDE